MSYSYYRSITVDHTKCGASDSSDFPVLVSITADANLKSFAHGGHVQSSSGFDIAFYSDSSQMTVLNYELEFYDGSAGTVVMWVKVPTLAHATDTVIYMFYGNSSVTTDQSSTSTWDSSYVAVHHYADGSSLTVKDSARGNNGTITGSVTATSGKIDGAASLDGSTGYITDPVGVSFNTPTSGVDSLTLELWIYLTDVGANTHVPFYADGGGDHSSPYFSKNSDNTIWIGPTPFANPTKTSTTVSPNVWTHCVWVCAHTAYSSFRNHIYINGAEASYSDHGADGSLGAFTGCLIGAYGGSILKWQGKLDEVRISKAVRSVDYITASYNNQNSPGTFITVGVETAAGGAGGLFLVGNLCGIGSGGPFFQNPLI